jgi:hypothetical protein
MFFNKEVILLIIFINGFLKGFLITSAVLLWSCIMFLLGQIYEINTFIKKAEEELDKCRRINYKNISKTLK